VRKLGAIAAVAMTLVLAAGGTTSTVEGYLCLTRTGQLALATDMFVSGQLEAVSLALNPSTSAFVAPAKPTPWNKGGLPNLCGKVQCPSNGLL
jgi:hypothetical protein